MVKAAELIYPDLQEDIQYAGLEKLKPVQATVFKKRCVATLVKIRREFAGNVKMIVDLKIYGQGEGKEEKYSIDMRIYTQKRNIVIAKETDYGLNTAVERVIEKIVISAKRMSEKRDDRKSKYKRDRKNYEESARLIRKRPDQKLTFSRLVKR